ncbi:hypothetical protein HG530_013696 [Fusarium avenaceum]|nr:hypothetical protein HG530_013696 [Fusarium avenaceum]
MWHSVLRNTLGSLSRVDLNPNALLDSLLATPWSKLDIVCSIGEAECIDISARLVEVAAARRVGPQAVLVALDWFGDGLELTEVFLLAEISPFGSPGRAVFEAAAWRDLALRCLDRRGSAEE